MRKHNKRILTVMNPVLRSGGGGGVLSGAAIGALVSWWKLDEESGNRADAHGSNTLTDVNTVLYAAGKQGNAADFNQSSEESLSVADGDDSLDPGDVDWCVWCWVNADSLGRDMGIISKDENSASPSNRQWRLQYYKTANRFRFLTFDASDNVAGDVKADQLGNVSTATWYFVVAWHIAATSTIYLQVNNGTADSAAESGTPAQGSADIQIGRYDNSGSAWWDGHIDEVGMCVGYALTADERTALYNAGAGVTYATAVGA